MSRVTYAVLGLAAYISIIAIGFGVPYIFMSYAISYNLDFLIAAVVSVIAIIGACGLGVVVTAILFGEAPLFTVEHDKDIERLNILRAQTRAMLDEMDDMIDILEDIRNILRDIRE